MPKSAASRLLWLLAAAAILPACGGGGSSGGALPVDAVLEFALAVDTATEGDGTKSLTVTRVGGNQDISVAWTAAATTAVDPTDFTAASGTLTWTAGDTASQTINVAIGAADAVLDGPKTFTVTLSAPTGATLGLVQASVVTIADGDSAGVIEFSAASASVAEGAGTISLNVTRTGGTVPVTATFSTTNGSATAGVDYTAVAAGPLSWAAGDTSNKLAVIPIAASGDGFEGDEDFTVTLLPTSGATPGTNTLSTVTITDGDAPPDVPGVVQFTAATATTAEGTGASVTLTVSRTGGVGAVSVQYATANGVATAGADYTATTGTLNWASGDFANKTFQVPIADFDGLVEGEEIFTVSLSSPTNATVGTPATCTVTIGDADSPSEGVFQFSQLVYSVTEGGGTNVTITVRRTGGTTGAVSVDCSVVAGGSATAGADYTDPGTVTLNWADGDPADQTFTIAILDDGADGPGAGIETINLALSNPTPNGGPEISINQGTATVEITDSDQNGELAFEFLTYTVLETGVSATMRVTRSGGTSGAIGVSVALSAGAAPAAVAGVDYTDPGAITLSWAAADTTPQTFTIFVIDNGTADGTRNLLMTLNTPTGGATIAPINNAATLSIGDDDAGFFGFSASTYAQLEGNVDGTFTVFVNRTGGSLGAATVQVLLADGTATAGDYSVPANPVLLSFADGETSKPVIIDIVGDTTFELDETFTLTLQAATGASLGAPTVATATIQNDDFPPGGLITLSSATYTVDEDNVDGFVTITINRAGTTLPAVAVTLKTSNGSAKGNGGRKDYDATNVSIPFALGQTVATFNIPITDDTRIEGNETFRVQLLNPTGGAGLGTPALATVTIISED
jgi:hypothetical protein